MKQFFLFSFTILLTLSQLCAQDEPAPEVDPIFGNALPDSQDPFAGKTSTANSASSKIIAPPKKNGIVSNPIDGGLSVLLITGALYGAKQYRTNRKKASVSRAA